MPLWLYMCIASDLENKNSSLHTWHLLFNSLVVLRIVFRCRPANRGGKFAILSCVLFKLTLGVLVWCVRLCLSKLPKFESSLPQSLQLNSFLLDLTISVFRSSTNIVSSDMVEDCSDTNILFRANIRYPIYSSYVTIPSFDIPWVQSPEIAKSSNRGPGLSLLGFCWTPKGQQIS